MLCLLLENELLNSMSTSLYTNALCFLGLSDRSDIMTLNVQRVASRVEEPEFPNTDMVAKCRLPLGGPLAPHRDLPFKA
jgi:hypothetical protein